MLGTSVNESKVSHTRLTFDLPMSAKEFFWVANSVVVNHPEFKNLAQYDDAFKVSADDEYLYIDFPEHEED